MRLKICLTTAFAAAMILCIAGVTVGQEKVGIPEGTQIVEQVGNKGMVNWTEGTMEAIGIGAPPERYIGKPQARPNALRAAQVDAYRNLLEVINGVRVDSTTVIRDFMTESDVINTQVQGMVKGAKVIKQEYMSDGTVEVTVRMPIAGNFAAVIIPRIMEKKQVQPPPAGPAAPAPAPAPGGEVFTGLVVDARGIQARPAMSPRIIDENGREIYGSMNVEREYAVQQGMSGYARDLTAAQSNARVTNNPLSVKGLKTEGAGRSDIVIAKADAEKILAAGDNLSFLKKCRVMIVLD
ncbi:MAG: LPP20 family lipoprotein [Proteobacteria bacterium]|nr:LPP20 family lipoprotein [Pseudomonadota bacterium]MBU3932009.1 LPP20 family lipoprotein [Pseudomonadota bacterium]